MSLENPWEKLLYNLIWEYKNVLKLFTKYGNI